MAIQIHTDSLKSVYLMVGKGGLPPPPVQTKSGGKPPPNPEASSLEYFRERCSCRKGGP
jgi:hypothetical protein